MVVGRAGPQGPSGAWHHYGVTYAKGMIVIDVDGLAVGSDSGLIGSPYLTELKVGNYSLNSNNFAGLLDDLAIWGQALAGPDVQSLYARTRRPAELANLVADWTFSEGMGKTVADESGNGHTLFLSNVGWAPSCAP